MPTKVLPCNCEHASQDKIYGPKQRLHNLKTPKSAGAAPAATCTVCGNKKG